MGIIRLDAAEDNLSDKLSSSGAELSILAGVDSSAYVVWGDLNTPLALRTFDHAPYANWYADERLFVADFRQVRIAWCGHTALLIPARLFDPTRPELYLQQLTLLPQGMEVQAEAIAELDAPVARRVQPSRTRAAEHVIGHVGQVGHEHARLQSTQAQRGARYDRGGVATGRGGQGAAHSGRAA